MEYVTNMTIGHWKTWFHRWRNFQSRIETDSALFVAKIYSILTWTFDHNYWGSIKLGPSRSVVYVKDVICGAMLLISVKSPGCSVTKHFLSATVFNTESHYIIFIRQKVLSLIGNLTIFVNQCRIICHFWTGYWCSDIFVFK